MVGTDDAFPIRVRLRAPPPAATRQRSGELCHRQRDQASPLPRPRERLRLLWRRVSTRRLRV